MCSVLARKNSKCHTNFLEWIYVVSAEYLKTLRGVCQVNVELIHIGSQWKLRQKIW